MRAETSKLRFGYYHLTTEQQLTTTQPSLHYEPDTLQWLQIYRIPLPSPRVYNALQVTETELIAAIKSFSAGSVGGPGGIRPQHILDLTNNLEAGPALVTSLTTFINMLLTGRCPDFVIPVFFGGNLIALEKKCGGIRPIAIGYTLRRLAANALTHRHCTPLAPNCYPNSSVSAHLVAAKLLFTRQDVFWQTCHPTTY